MIALFTIGFGRPDLLREQKRLLDKHLRDAFTLHVLDNTQDTAAAENMRVTAADLGLDYTRVNGKTGEHPEALALARRIANEDMNEYWGCLDHDIFPFAPATLVDKIDQAGFLGLGQTYSPRHGAPLSYLWPGWIFFSRKWLAGRTPNFDGIRGQFKFDDGDCGSLLHSLFTDEDWGRLASVKHGYGTLREEDGHGLQSFGYEEIDSAWIHFTNGSRWKSVPDPAGRDDLIRERLAQL